MLDIGNILGQACRLDTPNAELWRLKVLIPLLVSYLFGAIIGQVAYSSMRDNAMIFPFLFTGSLAIMYLMLPVVKSAKKEIEGGFKTIVSEIEEKTKSFFQEPGTIFHADKDQAEILPNVPIKTPNSDENRSNDHDSEDVIIM